MSEQSILVAGKTLKVRAPANASAPNLLIQEANQDVMCQLLKKSASYCTSEGRVKGALTICEYFVCFEVETEKCIVKRSDEEKVEAPHSCYYCYVDMHDVLQCKYVVEGSKHFLHLFATLRAVEGALVKVVFRLSKKKDVFDDFLTPEKLAEESTALCKAIVEFRDQIGTRGLRAKSVIPFCEEFEEPQKLLSVPGSGEEVVESEESEESFSNSSDEVPAEESAPAHALPSLSISDSPAFHGHIKKKILSIKSSILTEPMFSSLRKELPKVFQLRNWKLVYSPSEHGTALRTMYRNACEFGATLLIIEDTTHTVFGGFVSEPWRVTKRFYGTGESFLFTFKGSELRAFHATLLNEYYVISDLQAVIFGAGVQSGLFLAADLVNGRSSYCDTYGNNDLAGTEEFKILNLELWGFV